MSDDMKRHNAGKLVWDKKLELFYRIPDELPEAPTESVTADPAAEYERLSSIPQADIDARKKQSRKDFRAWFDPIRARLKMLRLPHADVTQIVGMFERHYDGEGVPFDQIVDMVCRQVETVKEGQLRADLMKLIGGDPATAPGTKESDADTAVDGLTTRQRKIVEFLMGRKHFTAAETMKEIPGAFKYGVDSEDRAVTAAVDRINRTWLDHSFHWTITVKDAKGSPRFKLER